MPSSDRIIFNGNDLSTLVMCRMERPIMPPVEVTTATIGGRHGELFKRARLQGYTVPVTMWLRSTDRRKVANIRHELAAKLWTDAPAPLYLPDDPTRYHMAIVADDTGLGEVTDLVPEATVNFYVCDPVAYGELRTSTLANNTETEVEVGGTWASKPTVTTTAAGGTWRITNATTSKYVEINADTFGGEIAADAVVVCDMELERVTVNGNVSGVTIGSDFFDIEGDCTLIVTGSTSTTVEWRERWL